jgi:hypothetical protein
MDNLVKYEEENIKDVETLQMFLNSPPEKVKINTLANNSKYVPIDEIERQLDTLFLGLWQTENFKYQVVANEIIGNITLKVFHPFAKTWISREGAGSVMIMVGKDQKAVIENKIKNTLVSGFPKLKTECIKNAAKSLGTIFGRNLNRKETSNPVKFSEKLEQINLHPEHKLWNAVVNKIKAGATDIQKVKQFYNISNENENKLIESVQM